VARPQGGEHLESPWYFPFYSELDERGVRRRRGAAGKRREALSLEWENVKGDRLIFRHGIPLERVMGIEPTIFSLGS
jgi:hypothetical protein